MDNLNFQMHLLLGLKKFSFCKVLFLEKFHV